MKDSVDREVILEQIKDELQGAYGWGKQIHGECINVGYTERAFGYIHRAEALIELLEVHDCGSTGGFDSGARGLYSLEERFKLLRRKKKAKKQE